MSDQQNCPSIAAPCGYRERPGAQEVALLSGARCCSWCPLWREECADREVKARAILALPDRPARLSALARLEQEAGAEARARMERVILEIWERRRARTA